MEHIWTNMNNMNDLWQNMERHGLDNRGFQTGKPRGFLYWKTVRNKYGKL